MLYENLFPRSNPMKTVLLLDIAGSSICTYECANLWEHQPQDGAHFRGAGLLILILAQPLALEGKTQWL
jgi:hypothetical protein